VRWKIGDRRAHGGGCVRRRRRGGCESEEEGTRMARSTVDGPVH
jgi:hypothetical protein